MSEGIGVVFLGVLSGSDVAGRHFLEQKLNWGTNLVFSQN
jgi:hypothetical protein